MPSFTFTTDIAPSGRVVTTKALPTMWDNENKPYGRLAASEVDAEAAHAEGVDIDSTSPPALTTPPRRNVLTDLWSKIKEWHELARESLEPHAFSTLSALFVLSLVILVVALGFASARVFGWGGSKNRQNDAVVLYAFKETEDARRNAEFFLRHGLHDNIDFIFIVNGPSPNLTFPSLPNSQTIFRRNECFDLGGYGEVLNANSRALVKKYKRFILLNASVMGPFVPHWSRECWSSAYLNRLSDTVKLVGMSANCPGYVPAHVQSMILATDRVGVEILLNDKNAHSFSSCPAVMDEAILVETHATQHIREAGYKADAMMQEFQTDPDNYLANCHHGDLLFQNQYFGGNVHPYETLFAKTKRGIAPEFLAHLAEWTDKANYSSYDYC